MHLSCKENSSISARHILHWHTFSQKGLAKSWRDGHNYCTERFKYVPQRNLFAANPGSYINSPNFHVHVHQSLSNYPFFSRFKTNTPIYSSSERRNQSCLLIRCQGYLRKERKNIIVEAKVAHYILPSENTKALNTWNQLNCVVTLWKAVNYLNWAVWQGRIKMRQGQNSSRIGRGEGIFQKRGSFHSRLPSFSLTLQQSSWPKETAEEDFINKFVSTFFSMVLRMYANPFIIRFKNSISWDNQTSKNSILVLIRF